MYIHWRSATGTRLPDYEEEVFLTLRKVDTDEKEITIGMRTKTDKDGEHWSYITPNKFGNLPPKEIEVIGWSEKEDPYDPS